MMKSAPPPTLSRVTEPNLTSDPTSGIAGVVLESRLDFVLTQILPIIYKCGQLRKCLLSIESNISSKPLLLYIYSFYSPKIVLNILHKK